jgi:hypothetical protein
VVEVFDMTDEEVARMRRLKHVALYRCPNNDHVIHTHVDDDKAMCNCGMANEALEIEWQKFEEVNNMLHYVALLEKA